MYIAKRSLGPIAMAVMFTLLLSESQSPVRGADNKAPPPLPGGGSVSFDPNALPSIVAAGQPLAGTVVVPPGTYTRNTGWTVSNLQVEVRPVGGGAGGNTVVADNIQFPNWGTGNNLNPPVAMSIANPGGGAFPVGKYNVQASIRFSKTGETDLTTWSAIVPVEVK